MYLDNIIQFYYRKVMEKEKEAFSIRNVVDVGSA